MAQITNERPTPDEYALCLEKVIEAVKNFHRYGNGDYRSHGHHGAFEYCTEEPCLGVLKAYPDAVPADRRPDWIEGAKSLDRHN